MAKWQNDLMLDAALDYISSNVNEMHVCTNQPTTRTEATTTYNLATVAFGSGDCAKADGDTDGRKMTFAAKNGVSVTASGDADHIALTSAGDLLLVTTCTTQTLTNGNTVNIPAWKDEIADVA
jgi:hypothetical protein